MPSRQLGEIAIGQNRHVFRPFPKRNCADRHDIEPVEQVFPEPAFAHLDREVTVRRREHPNVDGKFLVAPDGHHDPLLQDAKQFGLQFEFHFPDLVEEDRPGVGRSKAAEGRRGRPGEGSLHVAEHVAREQGARGDRAVHRNERPRRPRTAAMNGSGDQFLAGSTRPHDQDARVVRRHQLDRPPHLLGPRRNPDDPLDGWIDAGSLQSFFRHSIHARAAPEMGRVWTNTPAS